MEENPLDTEPAIETSCPAGFVAVWLYFNPFGF